MSLERYMSKANVERDQDMIQDLIAKLCSRIDEFDGEENSESRQRPQRLRPRCSDAVAPWQKL